MQVFLRSLLLISTLTVSVVAQPGEVIAAYNYCNERFNFCVDVPLTWEQQELTLSGDGATFSDVMGMEMTVSGNNNPLLLDVAGAIEQANQEFSKVTYRKKGKDWFVLSGYAGNSILYIKEYVGDTQMNTLRLEYPTAKKQYYDADVNHVVKSFNPGVQAQ